MERTSATGSKFVKSYGYNPAEQELEIELVSKPGTVYRYKPVTPEEFAAFAAAESKGSHFLKLIKPAKACVKAEEKTDATENNRGNVGGAQG